MFYYVGIAKLIMNEVYIKYIKYHLSRLKKFVASKQKFVDKTT